MVKLKEKDCLYGLQQLNENSKKTFQFSKYNSESSRLYFTPRVVRDFLYEKSCYDRQGTEQKQIGEIESILEVAVEEKLANKSVSMVSVSNDVRVGYRLSSKGKKLATKINMSKKRLQKLRDKQEGKRLEEKRYLSFP